MPGLFEPCWERQRTIALILFSCNAFSHFTPDTQVETGGLFVTQQIFASS